jgi:formylglycine-generating enzyme required for sulfatase activity
MTSSTRGGIVRNGQSGSYTYSVKPPDLNGTYAYDNKPVNYVSWGDAARFTNWMHNGQPSGQETENTTENGAYALNGATTNAQLMAVTRNPNARWWLPSENEWYKAAYHKNDGVTNHYWTYPTASNSAPNNNLPSGDTGNSANIYGNFYATGNSSYPLTDVGAYTLTDGPYGTYDQAGSVKEWVDTQYSSGRPIRGGAYNTDSDSLKFDPFVFFVSTTEERYLGFRVASILEPNDFGDYSDNDVVDAADYVRWRKVNGPPNDYNMWRANFGTIWPSSGNSLYQSAVPEPSTAALASIFALLASRRRRCGYLLIDRPGAR